MRRRGAIALGSLALVVAAGSAGLSLAQDQAQNQTQPADVAAPPPTAPQAASPGDDATGPAPAAAASSPVPIALPPPVAAPEPVAATPAPANVTAEAPANTVADAAPPPAPKRPRYQVVVLQALDKATAETLRFEAKVGEPIRYKDLVIVPHACETQASDEPYAQTAAHLEVQFQPADQPLHGQQVAREVFRGWMFADAPGLHPFEHPTYDLWVIACKTPSPAPSPPAAGAHL
jgi:hypothetical protein